MALTTKEQVKVFLQIPETDKSKDGLIDALIPGVADKIWRYAGNYFDLTGISYESSSLAFVEADKKITDSNNQFVTEGFTDGTDICISNSLSNDGLFSLVTATEGSLTVAENLLEETIDESSPMVTRIKYPPGVQFIAARMVGYNINPAQVIGITEEALADWRVKYGSGKIISGYPDSITSGLEDYKKLTW